MAEVQSTLHEKGNISVHTENIFPIIKKSLYSDHEIFLRELVSNAVDASQKLKYLSGLGKVEEELGDLTIHVKLDKENKTLTISDRGIGMTADEVKKYINQVAFSGAQEFVQKFRDAKDTHAIIGQFGLGFYSAFMVSEKVGLVTRSHEKDATPVKWVCDGSTEYTMDATEKESRGTDVILYLASDSEEFLEKDRITRILNKYCRFLPVQVEFEGETFGGKDALWLKAPSALKDEDYLELHRTLYPFAEEPLFWIHLNVDYPFTLNGILFFPRQRNEMENLKKDRIHLYSRGVFITDNVEEIVPEYLLLLQGVIESPDIPLNVSRSFLQADSSVKKISSYITRKVAEKLKELFQEDRAKYEEKWPFMEIFVRYGLISDDKFWEQAKEISLVKSTDGKWYTTAEYEEKIRVSQTDKKGDLIWLYTTDPKSQDAYLQTVKSKGYDAVEMTGIIDNHFVSAMEQKLEKTQWKRVDGDSPERLIEKEEAAQSPLTEEEEKSLVELFESVRRDNNMSVRCEAMGENELPVMIIRPEFMRRMKEMSQGGMAKMFGDYPEMVNLVLNTSHPLAKTIVERKTKDSKEKMARQLLDLALLSQGMLSGADLTEFIRRSVGVLG